ncbi:Beta-1-3-glucosyltransferase-like [Homarus americanus]|uniref:N-acetylgalactosaminide beta-1,3-galactosyltransferase n=1 Tax=Homarus americanus TaxID=6706 RepID=A0A8J5JKI0_HOMAM|nr:Beta-1-3-glucosyltransferase-like [Homarus americanus]
MMDILRAAVLILLITRGIHCSQRKDSFVFVILSQESARHTDAARALSSHLTAECKQLDVPCVVHLAWEDWPGVAAWTYFPLLERLSNAHGTNSSWVIILEEWVTVRLGKLVHLLHDYNPSQRAFIGRGLADKGESIIHHFTVVDPSHPLYYPDTRAGMVLSTVLVNRIASRWSAASTRPGSDFTIDAPYEFASFVKSDGVELTHHESVCVQEKPGCERYHGERLPIIQATWLKDATNHAIYSDVEDAALGTVSLGVPNTREGHCGKTLAIIHRAAELPSIQWLAVVDDDTLISVPRLRRLLSCYDPQDLVALGEKYGFAATTPHGYDYITGGGGMVFSKALVEQLAAPGVCKCPSDNTPDDMFLGVCLRKLSVPIIHSSAFHQNRPNDYPEELLQEGELPLSFHRYWMSDPLEEFARWLNQSSASERSSVSDSSPGSVHVEL